MVGARFVVALKNFEYKAWVKGQYGGTRGNKVWFFYNDEDMVKSMLEELGAVIKSQTARRCTEKQAIVVDVSERAKDGPSMQHKLY